jgi:hypothetical protein
MRARAIGDGSLFSIAARMIAVLFAALIVAGTAYTLVPKPAPQRVRPERFRVTYQQFETRSFTGGLSILLGKIALIGVSALIGRKILRLRP